MGKHSKINIIIANGLLVLLTFVICLAVVEILIKKYNPYNAFGSAKELSCMRNNSHDLKKSFTIDPDFGFRPIFGNGSFNKYGTHINKYSLEKKPGVMRVLFIGDSITSRGRIINALKRIYGEEKIEYWNAGVESFNTVQEVNFYKKYNSIVEPDQVILTFHLNDFETTPIAFLNQEKRLVVFAPHMPIKDINLFLFKYSCLYRAYLAIVVNKRCSKEAIVDETMSSLAELKDILHAKGISFTVLVLPVLKRYREWSMEEKTARAEILQILKNLHIKYFDLFDVLSKAIDGGIFIQETPGDALHPSEEISLYFAKYLYENKLFYRGTL